MTQPLLTSDTVAAMLGMSRSWVLQHARGTRRPIIPSVKMGRAVRFRPDDLERFIEESLRENEAETNVA